MITKKKLEKIANALLLQQEQDKNNYNISFNAGYMVALSELITTIKNA